MADKKQKQRIEALLELFKSVSYLSDVDMSCWGGDLRSDIFDAFAPFLRCLPMEVFPEFIKAALSIQNEYLRSMALKVTIRKRSQVLEFTGVTPHFRIITKYLPLTCQQSSYPKSWTQWTQWKQCRGIRTEPRSSKELSPTCQRSSYPKPWTQRWHCPRCMYVGNEPRSSELLSIACQQSSYPRP